MTEEEREYFHFYADKLDSEMALLSTPGELTERFAPVFGMGDVFYDHEEYKLVTRADVRHLCLNRKMLQEYMEDDRRGVLRKDQVGFDPTRKDPTIKGNLWGGWPKRPKQGNCETLLDLLAHMCSGEKNSSELYRWVLRWFAYPIQHPGAKMHTSIVFHGPQGTGKNMWCEAVMGAYGEYGRIIDQAAVEDKFNDSFSRKLFLIADEVVARMELYHTKNKLKSLITGEWIRINPKNMGAYNERNHVNIVFLSNETQPVVLERDDRRYVVIWTPPKLDPGFYETVRLELEAGGVEALHWHLLNVDLGDFKPWSAPPMTSAKRDLIEISLDSSERFWTDWLGQNIPLPLCAARSDDLYDAYRHWCTRNGIAKPAASATFLGNCAKRQGAYKARRRFYPANGSAIPTQGTVYGPPVPPGTDIPTEIGQLTEQLNNFESAVSTWRKERFTAREFS